MNTSHVLATILSSISRVRPTPIERAPAPVPVQARPYLVVTPEDLAGPEPLWMTRRVLDDIIATVGSRPAEEGGMLGGRRSRGVITDFYFDTTADRTSVRYYPDREVVRPLLRDEWNPASIDLIGFVHSHPAGLRRPSSGDLRYAEQVLSVNGAMDRMVMPIVQTRPDTGSASIHGYDVVRARAGGVALRDIDIEILDLRTTPGTVDDPAFSRVASAYDLHALAGVRLVLVGAGGAASFGEAMARAGVGEFVLIDPDVVELANIGTQQTYRRDVGRPKVDAMAERILDINPHARVLGVRAHSDELTDDMFARLVHRPLANASVLGPSSTILCGFTDSFWAQARVNRLALDLGVAHVAAQVYEGGMGCEVSFHVPGRSVACGRCVLGGRYRAHLDPAVRLPEVTSHGTPLWATDRLNELKAQIVLAIAHGITDGDPGHPGRIRYEELLEATATRNLVQVRLRPDAPLPAFEKAFAGSDRSRIVTDETLWMPQEPENPDHGFPACPDCGGTGDLRDAIGTIADTRIHPVAAPATAGSLAHEEVPHR